jgi:hypothetical protein
LNASDYITSCLATRMYSEPKDDGLLGYTACGLVIRNRVVAGWGQWLDLIAKHDKFSANPDVIRPLIFGDPNHDTIFRRCLGIAETIYAGRERDLTEGALWYCRLEDCSDDFKERIIRPQQIPNEDGFIVPAHAMVAKIGRQMFFK